MPAITRTSPRRVRREHCDGSHGQTVAYASGDTDGLAKRVVGLTSNVVGAPMLSATLSTASASSILTGIVRIWNSIVQAIRLNKKPKEIVVSDEVTDEYTPLLGSTSVAKKTADVTERVFVGMDTARAVVEISSGVVGTAYAGLSISAIKTSAKTAAAAAKALGTASSVLGVVTYTIMAIPQAIKAAKTFAIVKELKAARNKVEDFAAVLEAHGDELKKTAPKAYAVIMKKGIDSIDLSDMDKFIKEVRGKAVFSILVVVTCVISILAMALGLAFSAGPGLIVAAVVSLIATLAMTGVDGFSMIQNLKEKTHLSTKNLVIKIITIILAAVTLVVSVAFAPTLALAVAGGIVGAIMMAIPIISIAVLKAKEERLKKESAEEVIAFEDDGLHEPFFIPQMEFVRRQREKELLEEQRRRDEVHITTPPRLVTDVEFAATVPLPARLREDSNWQPELL